ncbi:MAG: hypothetical protein EPGJADBJ_05128 [Saprospiraceae bacterium]|nr:hypothetical protein [Saprospiraceae bacterium]
MPQQLKFLEYKAAKGFGFLADEAGKRYFFHINVAQKAGLSESDFVANASFDVETETGDKGLKVVRFLTTAPSKAASQPPFSKKPTSNTSSDMAARWSDFSQKHSEQNFALKIQKVRLFDQQQFFDKQKLDLFKIDGKNFRPPAFDDTWVKQLCDNQYEAAKSLLGADNLAEPLELASSWRMAVGLGNTSVLETSMTLHRTYGIPYIPGSAIKGVVRSVVIADNHNNNEKEAIGNEQFCRVFGCPAKIERTESYFREAREGRLLFFDAFPMDAPVLETDIMNPHYPKYYGGDQPPADWQSPVPIIFLTVGKNTRFRFVIGVRKTEDRDLLQVVWEWLQKALTDKGIGAKTAVGYGYMMEAI